MFFMALNMPVHILLFSTSYFDYRFFAQLCYNWCEYNTKEPEKLAPTKAPSRVSAIIPFFHFFDTFHAIWS